MARLRGALRRVIPRPTTPSVPALDTGVFHAAFYQAQRGTAFDTPELAVADYVDVGHALGMLPHPLIDPELAHDAARSSALAVSLAAGTVASHEFSTGYDWDDYVHTRPGALHHPGGVIGDLTSAASPQLGGPVLRDRSGELVDWPRDFTTLGRRRRIVTRVLASGLFDRAYYEAQVGTPFLSERAAVWHYITVGEARGLAPHPLFEPAWYARQTPRNKGTAYLFDQYLKSGLTTVSPHPHFDPIAYLADVPDAGAHPGGPLAHILETATPDTMTVPLAGWTSPRPALELCERLLVRARDYAAEHTLASWGAARPWNAATETTEAQRLDQLTLPTGTTLSVVFDLARATAITGEVIERLLDAARLQIEIVAVADSADDRRESLDPRVQVVESASSSFGHRVNAAVKASRGDLVHVWHPGDVVDPDVLARSAAVLTTTDASIVYSAVRSSGPLSAVANGEPYDADGALWGDQLALSRTAVLTRSLVDRLDGYDESLPFREAWDLALRASAVTEPVFLGQAGFVADPSGPVEDASAVSAENVVRARETCDWSTPAARMPDRVSLLVPVFGEWHMTYEAVRATLDTTVGHDIEIVLADNASGPSTGRLMLSLFAEDTGVVYRRLPRNTGFAIGSNLAFLWSTGATVVFMNNDTEPEGAWLDPLVQPLDDIAVRGVQPLLLYPDRTVQAAGTGFTSAPAMPWHFLQGHPKEDVLAAGQTAFQAITAAFMACRATEIHALRGFDPVYVNGMEDVDLCLRLTAELGGSFRVALDSVVVHKESQAPRRFAYASPNRVIFLRRWIGNWPSDDLSLYAAAGLSGTYHGNRQTATTSVRQGRVVASRPQRLVTTGPAAGLPSLRWALKTAATPGALGDNWGDTYFADDLARALRGLGQDVVIDRRKAYVRERSDHLDDVVLAIRGLHQITPQPGATNILWVISHPDLVSDDELTSGFRLAYAASSQWATDRTTSSGREVRTLLQATDPRRFRPGPPDESVAADVLFVGRTRRIFRPIVRDAIAAGADLSVYGSGWDTFIDTSYIRADHLDNDELPAAYGSSRIVLNDHWADMAAHGFLSNRLFDAVASGARVITDEVPGLRSVFGSLVQEYATVDDLRALLAPDCPAYGTEEDRRAQVEAVARQHSFDARARTLLADVLDVRGVDHGLG